jgi:hypothetical protein
MMGEVSARRPRRLRGPGDYMALHSARGHAIVFKSDTMCGPNGSAQCVDSIASGPVLFGPSLGMLVELGKILNLVLGINTEFGLPSKL